MTYIPTIQKLYSVRKVNGTVNAIVDLFKIPENFKAIITTVYVTCGTVDTYTGQGSPKLGSNALANDWTNNAPPFSCGTAGFYYKLEGSISNGTEGITQPRVMTSGSIFKVDFTSPVVAKVYDLDFDIFGYLIPNS